MGEKKYSAMVSHSFWFPEFKTYINLIIEGKSIDDIKKLNEDENVFNASSKDRRLRIFGTLKRRIEKLDDSLVQLFPSLDITNQKYLNLISIMALDTLFFEFVYEIYREKIMIGLFEITDSDFRIFFKNKQIQNEIIGKWTEETTIRLSNIYKLFLSESGVTTKEQGIKKIIVPVLDPKLERCLIEQNMSIFIQALTGVAT